MHIAVDIINIVSRQAEISNRSMVSKTRERLIEVARQLFVRKGVENTTMLDIANASEKGRRTIYTYFRNKREIHQAVIERESEQIVMRQRNIQQSSATSRQKLERFMRVRLEVLLCPTSQKQRDSLSLLTLLEGSRVGKTRRLAALKELEILRSIVNEGVENGEFDPEQAARLLPLMVMLIQGIDMAAANESISAFGFDRDESYNHVIAFVLKGIMNPQTKCATHETNNDKG